LARLIAKGKNILARGLSGTMKLPAKVRLSIYETVKKSWIISPYVCFRWFNSIKSTVLNMKDIKQPGSFPTKWTSN